LDRLVPSRPGQIGPKDGPDYSLHSEARRNKNALSEGTNVDSIYKDAAGYLWLGGGASGLDRLDERTGRFKHYRYNPDDANGLMSDNVFTIYGDRNGHMWVGQQNGISRFDPATERFY
jgi:ligand-binding sensor domain-containing protein